MVIICNVLIPDDEFQMVRLFISLMLEIITLGNNHAKIPNVKSRIPSDIQVNAHPPRFFPVARPETRIVITLVTRNKIEYQLNHPPLPPNTHIKAANTRTTIAAGSHNRFANSPAFSSIGFPVRITRKYAPIRTNNSIKVNPP